MRSGLTPDRDAAICSVVMGVPLLDGMIKCYTFLRAIYQHFLQNKRKPSNINSFDPQIPPLGIFPKKKS